MSAPVEQAARFKIVVNLRPREWNSATITFEQVVALAYPDPAPPERIYTVAWQRGREAGSLVAGQSVDVQNGMNFSVTFTDRS